jgi:hypothetical protein
LTQDRAFSSEALPRPSEPADPAPGTTDAVALQILATEHWSLLATRSLSWNESFSRASMFLSVVSGAVVALALVSQATSFGDGFFAFALVLLPVVLFVGIATFIRLVAINNEDIVWVAGMNRLRAAYLAQRPDLGRYFVTSAHDDEVGITITFGMLPHPDASMAWRAGHGLVTTPATVGVVVASLAGVLGGLVAFRVTGGLAIPLALGAASFLATILPLFAYQGRQIYALRRRYPTDFPSPAGDVAPRTRKH